MKLLQKILNKALNILFYLCLFIMLWVVGQIFCFTSFRIPTDSMEPALIPGDNIVVNKMVGGARLFDVFKSLNREEIDIYRLPGFGSFKRNDVLVFNFPYPAQWDSIGFDIMRYYVKRCIALPGDTLEIRNGFFSIRGLERELGNRDAQRFISNLPDTLTNGIEMEAFPLNKEVGWTIKEFGPLPVPAKGQTIQMNRKNGLLYRNLIFWEQKKRVRLDAGHVYLGDSLIESYCFRNNYYFMSGDKLANSQDSRYWGLLPEEFIVGRADYIWLSRHGNKGKIDWKRFMNRIH